MELQYSPSKKNDFESFLIERRKSPYFGGNWHYHEEYELIFTIKGHGVRIVGDHMDYFNDPELILIGSNVPHLFKNDDTLRDQPVDYIVLKFKDIFNVNSIFNLPEMAKIKQMLANSKRGLLFSQETINKVKKLLIKLAECSGAEKILTFLQMLHILSGETSFNYLCSENFILSGEKKNEDRIHNVINYISEKYTKDITLDDLAEVSHMTTNSFCRYFKSRTGKTAFQFIREYRINKACQMLINGEKSISEVCYDTGFNSFSSFNRIFKSMKNISASEYKGKFMLTSLNE